MGAERSTLARLASVCVEIRFFQYLDGDEWGFGLGEFFETMTTGAGWMTTLCGSTQRLCVCDVMHGVQGAENHCLTSEPLATLDRLARRLRPAVDANAAIRTTVGADRDSMKLGTIVTRSADRLKHFLWSIALSLLYETWKSAADDPTGHCHPHRHRSSQKYSI